MDNALYRGLRADGGGWEYGNLINWHPILNPRIVWSIKLGESAQELDYVEVVKEVIPETVGQLLHVSKDGRKWWAGDIVEMEIHVAASTYNDGDGWLYNDDDFNGLARGELCMHPRYGLCIKNYTLTDTDNEVEVEKTSKYKTITLTRSAIIGNIHESNEYNLQ